MRSLLVIAIIVLTGAPAFGAPGKKNRAETLARRALASYSEGRYAEASDRFLRAFELSGEPTQLRNAAKSAELAGEREKAIEHWSLFRALAVRGADIREAEKRLLELERKVAEAPGAVDPAVVEPAVVGAAVVAPAVVDSVVVGTAVVDPAVVEPAVLDPGLVVMPAVQEDNVAIVARPLPEIDHTPKWLMGSGGAILAGSFLLFVHAETSLQDLRSSLATKDGDGLIVGIDRTDAIDDQAAIVTERRIALGAVAVGSALLAGGVLWMLSEEAEL
jgi:hypothetical protein